MVALSNTSWNSEGQKVEVLLVEDEVISRRALALLLQAKGFATRSTGSAEDALRLLKQGIHPHVALVDLDLPGMNGLELIDHLAHLHPAIPAVLITASSLERLKEMLREHDVPYMRKPLDLIGLLKLLPPAASH
jgi:CheY-like chemotaxis protein